MMNKQPIKIDSVNKELTHTPRDHGLAHLDKSFEVNSYKHSLNLKAHPNSEDPPEFNLNFSLKKNISIN